MRWRGGDGARWAREEGGKEKKEVKKKVGVFGVPLDQLVERAGSDSVLGANDAHLKVPTFVEDIISAMKQMGE